VRPKAPNALQIEGKIQEEIRRGEKRQRPTLGKSSKVVEKTDSKYLKAISPPLSGQNRCRELQGNARHNGKGTGQYLVPERGVDVEGGHGKKKNVVLKEIKY